LGGESTVHDEQRQEVATVKLYVTERPSALTSACAPSPGYGIEAHTLAVGIPAVLGTRLGFVQQQETVQVQRTQAQWSWNLADRRRNGFAAKTNGMDHTSAYKGVKVSGVPPRGKPV
jgi:hypothetical protein